MLKEFKEFIMRGNVIDMAVGIIIGAAFGAIIKSLVGDILMAGIRSAAGRSRFYQPVHRAAGRLIPSPLRNTCRRAGSRRGDHELRAVF